MMTHNVLIRMEFLEHSRTLFDATASLERMPEVSDVESIELDKAYFNHARQNLRPEVYAAIETNHKLLKAYRFAYRSDGLSIKGFLWIPRNMRQPLPLVVWNRGGAGEFASIGEKGDDTIYSRSPCELAKCGAIVVASQYRGGLGSEGKDEYGGDDLRDVVRVKEIAEQLPLCKRDARGKAIVAGASRGGMMSYLLAAREPWVKAVVSLSGVSDVAALGREVPEMRPFFKKCFKESDEETARRSAMHFYAAIPKELPILMLHGTADSTVPVRQSQNLYDLLRESGHTVEYHALEGADHYFYDDLRSPHREEAWKIIRRFVQAQL